MPNKNKWAQRGLVRYMSSNYDNLDGDILINLTKEINANLTMVGYTGTSGKREEWKWKAIRAFIQRAHEEGIIVSTYMKTTSIQWKPMFDQRPESKDWIMLFQDGRPALYSRDPERYMGCVNNTGWREFLKEMIRGAVDVGVDGLFYDNHFIPRQLAGSTEEGFAEAWACYCKVCFEQFKVYTQKNLGWPCDLPKKPDWDDPVWQAFIDFRDESLIDVTRMIVNYAHELKPDIVVYPNVCPPWFGGGGAKGSVTKEIAGIVDVLLFEGDTQPRLEVVGGLPRPINAAVDWKYATALTNKPVFSRAHSPNDVYTPDHSMLGIAESIAFGGLYNYLIPSSLQEDEVKREGVKRYYGFLKENQKFYNDVTEPADVAILVSNRTTDWFLPDQVSQGDSIPRNIPGMAQALAELHIPFNVVVDEQVLQDHGYRVLVLPNVACMSDEQARAIQEFVRGGGSIVATGETSLYDEKYRIRDDFILSDVFGFHHGQVEDGVIKNQFGDGLSVYLPGNPEEIFFKDALPSSLGLIKDALDYSLRGDYQIRLDAPNTTLLNISEKVEDNVTFLHLLNYESKVSPMEIAVELRKPTGRLVGNVTVLSPDTDGPEVLETTEDSGGVCFTVPHLRLYNLVTVEWK